MELLQLTKADAILIYKAASKEIKTKLENVFGKNVFEPRHYTSIKTFEDAAEAEGLTPEEIARYKTYKNKEEEIEHHYGMLRIIAKAIRGEWTPDFSNPSQYKYYPWFRWSGVGFVFDASGTYCDYATTDSGSRLCFQTREQSDYFGTQFLSIWKVVLEN